MVVEETIKKLLEYESDNAYNSHSTKTKSCIGFGRILQEAKSIESIITPFETKHLKSCKHCQKKLNSLSFAQISRSNLLAAAGSQDVLTNICGDSLGSDNSLSNVTIVCEEPTTGFYEVWIQSDLPMAFRMTFLKDEEILHETEISRSPFETDQLIPAKKIKEWTSIKFNLLKEY